MQRDSLFMAALFLVIILMFTFGSELGMKVQTVLAGPVRLSPSAGMLATVSQTVEGYGMTHTTATSTPEKGIMAPVYSRYPFNLKSEILIAAGRNSGVNVGDVALYQGSLLGSVEKVFADSALVQTIFDNRFKAPVRIGSSGTDALLVGGPEPQLTLIPQSAGVAQNDQVYAAGENFPYGATLGALQDLSGSADNIYRSAALRVFYNPASMNAITVVPKGS
jgi:cell shape-determining protein MreC